MRNKNLDRRSEFRPSFLDELQEHGHLQFPRGVDGQSVVDALVNGVSADDVSSGAVDTTSLTRAQQAAFAIDGFLPAVSEAANQWTPIDVDDESLGKLFPAGGILTFRQDNSVFTQEVIDIAAEVTAPRAALLWNDSIVAQPAFRLDISVLHGAQSLILDSGPIRGNRLTLWIESSLLSFAVVAVSPPGTAEQAAAKEKDANTILPNAGNLGDGLKSVGSGIEATASKFGETVNNAIGKFFDVQLEVGLALVVVAGIAFFLWLEDKGPTHG